MQKITPFLWFNDKAEEAMHFYTSIFKNSIVISTTPGPDGKVMGVTFEIEGTQFRGFNGGPQFTFNEAISFMVDCDTQAEIDYYWEKLGAGGTYQACGWLKDAYGLSWQIIPKRLGELLSDPDPNRAHRVLQAMLQMTKITIAELELAAG